MAWKWVRRVSRAERRVEAVAGEVVRRREGASRMRMRGVEGGAAGVVRRARRAGREGSARAEGGGCAEIGGGEEGVGAGGARRTGRGDRTGGDGDTGARGGAQLVVGLLLVGPEGVNREVRPSRNSKRPCSLSLARSRPWKA